MKDKETYLGDAVYASFDGFQIKLRTGDGNDQVIYLDPCTYHSLTRYASQIWRERAARDAAAKDAGHGT